MKKIAVITGADSGLGREYTRLILEESNVDEIWALAKTPARLQRLARLMAATVAAKDSTTAPSVSAVPDSGSRPRRARLGSDWVNST